MTCNSASIPPTAHASTEIGGHDLADIADAVPSASAVYGDAVVTGVSDDSRTVEPGDLYLAFPGRHAHGLDFELEALARGAVAILSDRPAVSLPSVVVTNPRSCAGPASALVHRHPSKGLRVYGTTGTNGKTSTTYLLGAALSAAGETVGTITGISIAGPRTTRPAARTTPEAAVLQQSLAAMRDEGATSVALEVSSHALDQGRVDATHFAAVGFTNLTRDHLDYHRSMDEYFAVKSRLFESHRTEVAAIGIDGDYGRRLASSVGVPCWTWSASNPEADIHADRIRSGPTGTSFTAHTPDGPLDVRLRLLGPHQVDNALTALAMLAATGVELDAAVAGFEQLTHVPGRLERVDDGRSGVVALVDYMHNTDGQHRLLPYLRSLSTGKLIVVIGATGDRDIGKRFPLGATAAEYADIVIVTDESPFSEDADTIRDAVVDGAVAAGSATVLVEPDRRDAFELAVEHARHGDVLVVAGRGCDDHVVHGNRSAPFDDRVELRAVLENSASTS